MPGGLAAWLNDDTSPKHRKKGSTNNGASASRLTPRALPRPIRKPLAAAAAAAEALHSPSGTSAIDVDAAVPDVATRLEKTAAFPRTSTGTTARAKMSSGHPLSCSDTCNNTSADSGLPRRLLKRVASSSKVIGITQGRDSPPTPEPASSWDPFESGDGKENSTNAFSMLLAPRKAGGGGFGARSALAVGKRKRPVGWSPHRAAAMAEAAGAATSFCECPVCGKRVIIELCSRHLDTECEGPTHGSTTDGASSPPPPVDSQASVAPSPPVGSPAAVTPSIAPAPPPSPSISSPPKTAGPRATCDSVPNATTPPAAAAAPADDRPRRTTAEFGGVDASCGASVPATNSPRSSPSPATTWLKPAASRKKTTPGAASAVAAVAAAATEADPRVMTACPVCGKPVRADLCSLHLDTDCAGVSSASSKGGHGVEAAGAGNRKGKSGGKSSPEGEKTESEREAQGKGVSEAAGGLTALAAELTCPVCLCLFEDAHSLPCSHRFCLECITGCFRSSKKQECPLCKVPAWKRDLKRDVPLKNILVAYRQMAKQ